MIRKLSLRGFIVRGLIWGWIPVTWIGSDIAKWFWVRLQWLKTKNMRCEKDRSRLGRQSLSIDTTLHFLTSQIKITKQLYLIFLFWSHSIKEIYHQLIYIKAWRNQMLPQWCSWGWLRLYCALLGMQVRDRVWERRRGCLWIRGSGAMVLSLFFCLCLRIWQSILLGLI